MSVAEFMGFSASFVPFIIVVAAIAVTVVQRNLRAPAMFAGVIISAFMFAGFLWLTQSLLGPAEPGPAPGGPDGGGGTVGEQLQAAFAEMTQNANAGCNTLILPYITAGIIPRPNVFFLAWVTAYLIYSSTYWSSKKGAPPTNPFVWVGVAMAWLLTFWNWNARFETPGGPVTCGGPWASLATAIAGTSLGFAYGGIVGVFSPTTLYFAPLASDNVICSRPQRSVFSCTIGSNAPSS